MRYMNDYELLMARSRFGHGSTPNRLALVLVVDNLAEQTNQVSDGWAYWQKPLRAAEKAIMLIQSSTYAENERQESEDITDAEMHAAVRPIKAFLTRHRDIYSPERRELILRAADTKEFQ